MKMLSMKLERESRKIKKNESSYLRKWKFCTIQTQTNRRNVECDKMFTTMQILCIIFKAGKAEELLTYNIGATFLHA